MPREATGRVTASPAETRSPVTIGELAEVVREAAASGTALRVVGGGTRQAFGNAGGPVGLNVSMARLNRIIDYSPIDLTIAVEPGCTISEINAVLAEHGQTLPLDVAHPESATIGGSFATGLSGPRRLKHGSLKDRVTGLEVINTSGRVTKSGGMVVKNVSGYELSRLHYGALGTFGILARINLKVAPRPAVLSGIVATYTSLDDAHAAGRLIAVSPLDPDAVIVSGRGDHWDLQLWFSGTPALAERQIERTSEQITRGDGLESSTSFEAASGRLERFEPFVDLQSGLAIVRVSAVATRQPGVTNALIRAGSREVCADIGSGLVYAIADPVPQWRDAVRRVVERPVFLALPEQLKRDIDVFGGTDPAPAAVLRRLKQEYDPSNLFNPGRFALDL